MIVSYSSNVQLVSSSMHTLPSRTLGNTWDTVLQSPSNRSNAYSLYPYRPFTINYCGDDCLGPHKENPELWKTGKWVKHAILLYLYKLILSKTFDYSLTYRSSKGLTRCLRTWSEEWSGEGVYRISLTKSEHSTDSNDFWMVHCW